MKFSKDVAEIVLYSDDGRKENVIYKEFDIKVSKLVRDLKNSIKGKSYIDVFLTEPNKQYTMTWKEVTSFEILNYEELLEKEKLLPKEEN